MSPKRLLILATETRASGGFVTAADKLGLEIVFGTEGAGAPLALRFDQRDSALRIVEYAMEHPVAGIIAVEDAAAAVAGRAASMLGLPYHPPRAGDALGDRKRLELRLAAAGLQVWSAANMVSHPSAQNQGARVGHPHSYSHPGAENQGYAVVGVMTLGTLRVLAIFNPEASAAKPLRLSSEIQTRVVETLRCVIKSVGLRHGPVYVELADNAEPGTENASHPGLSILGVSAAVPERYAQALRFRIPLVDENVSLEELLVRNALGIDIARVYRK